MWMNEFVKNCMILEVFIEFFKVKITIELSKIMIFFLIIRFDFNSNLIV